MLVKWKKAVDNHQAFGLASYSQLCLKYLTASIRLDSKSRVNFKIYDVAIWETNNYNTHIDQFFKRSRQLGDEI